jgi:hypothetical protein
LTHFILFCGEDLLDLNFKRKSKQNKCKHHDGHYGWGILHSACRPAWTIILDYSAFLHSTVMSVCSFVIMDKHAWHVYYLLRTYVVLLHHPHGTHHRITTAAQFRVLTDTVLYYSNTTRLLHLVVQGTALEDHSIPFVGTLLTLVWRSL